MPGFCSRRKRPPRAQSKTDNGLERLVRRQNLRYSVAVVGGPLLLRLIRPYGDEKSFVAGEGWTLTRTTMVLVDQGPIDEGTLVRFDVVLQNGRRLIRAEGTVIGFEPATGERPGGTRVRFRRFGASTKDFIDRVVAARRRGDGSQDVDEGSSPVAADAPERSSPRASLPGTPALGSAVDDAEGGSGVRRSLPRVVAAPPHREDLLARLRERFARREGAALAVGK